MLLEKLLKGANFSINIFNLEESKLFDQYFERILISKDTLLKDIVISFLMGCCVFGF